MNWPPGSTRSNGTGPVRGSGGGGFCSSSRWGGGSAGATSNGSPGSRRGCGAPSISAGSASSGCSCSCSPGRICGSTSGSCRSRSWRWWSMNPTAWTSRWGGCRPPASVRSPAPSASGARPMGRRRLQPSWSRSAASRAASLPSSCSPRKPTAFSVRSARRSRSAAMPSPVAPPAATPRRQTPQSPAAAIRPRRMPRAAGPTRRSGRESRWPSTTPPTVSSAGSSSSPTAVRPSASIHSMRSAARPRPPAGSRGRR